MDDEILGNNKVYWLNGLIQSIPYKIMGCAFGAGFYKDIEMGILW
jgi:hypothetical protein